MPLVGSTMASSALVTKLMRSTVPGFTGTGACARIGKSIAIDGSRDWFSRSASPALAATSPCREHPGSAYELRHIRNQRVPEVRSRSESASRSLAVPCNRRGRPTPLRGFARRVVVADGHYIEVVGQQVPLNLIRKNLLLGDAG